MLPFFLRARAIDPNMPKTRVPLHDGAKGVEDGGLGQVPAFVAARDEDVGLDA